MLLVAQPKLFQQNAGIDCLVQRYVKVLMSAPQRSRSVLVTNRNSLPYCRKECKNHSTRCINHDIKPALIISVQGIL